MGREFYGPFVGTLFKQITHVPEFKKDLKKLAKCFSSLEEDLKIFIKVAMNAFHKHNVDSRAIFCISDLGIHSPKIYKAKKFACKALKGKGALRYYSKVDGNNTNPCDIGPGLFKFKCSLLYNIYQFIKVNHLLLRWMLPLLLTTYITKQVNSVADIMGA